MSRYLVLVNAPAGSSRVLEELQQLNAPGASFRIVVPTTPLSAGEREFVQREEEPAEADEPLELVAARWRLREVLSLLHQQGLDATGEVTVRSPVGATEAAVAADRYDGVVVIARPGNFTSRIRLDLPSRIERRVTEPVLTIKA